LRFRQTDHDHYRFNLTQNASVIRGLCDVQVAIVIFSVTMRWTLWYISVNKHCSKILQETLLNSVSKDLLPFMVGQSHDSFALSRMCVISALSAGNSSDVHSEGNLGVK
jgi:hypothetical protein